MQSVNVEWSRPTPASHILGFTQIYSTLNPQGEVLPTGDHDTPRMTGPILDVISPLGQGVAYTSIIKASD